MISGEPDLDRDSKGGDAESDFDDDDSNNDPDYIPDNSSSENQAENMYYFPENVSATENEESIDQEPRSPSDQIVSKGRKRVRNEVNWSRNVAKRARLKGSPYKSAVAKKRFMIEGRKLKPPCSCPKKCGEKIQEDIRQNIFKDFWKETFNWDHRRQFIISMVDEVPKNRSRPRNNNQTGRRTNTKIYHLQISEGKIIVCKVMFLNTVGISEKFVRVALSKKKESGFVIPDKRGKHPPKNKIADDVRLSVVSHISSFPVYQSHYCREKTKRQYLGPELNISIMYRLYIEKCEEENIPENMRAKKWLYRKVFNEKFNLSFYQPSTDTCDDCDHFVKLLKETSSEAEKEDIKERQKKHHQEANLRYKLKSQDKEEAKKSDLKKLVVMVDLQKCLPTPCLSNSRSFYLRKLWTLNLTIHCDTTGQSYCMVWDETLGLRGGNEIASCIIKWALENLNKDVEELTIWSDNCSGQNRNKMIIPAYMWLLNEIPTLKIINHKYLLKGHTHMEADTVHAIIERKRKSLRTLEIAVPRDWAQFISTCGNKNPFIVYSMNMHDFKEVTSMSKGTDAPLVSRKKNTNGEQFYLSRVVWAQVRSTDEGILFYKTEFQEETFQAINLKRHVRLPLNFPKTLPVIRNTTVPIKSAKYYHLIELLQWIDKSFHQYYKSLKYSSTASDELDDEPDENPDNL